MLETFLSRHWNDHFPDSAQQQAIRSLENGQILYFPELAFSLQDDEQIFLSPTYSDPNAKNISYQLDNKKLWGVRNLSDQQHSQLKSMLDRYSRASFELIKQLLPRYAQQVKIARTSFRPVEISNRKSSYRKDDKRLHVDAFPSAPNQGKRILRVFTNINPNGKARVWRVGEPFEDVAKRFLPTVKKPVPGSAMLMNLFNITKSYRTLYDHYMLHIHDNMKADEKYQQNVSQQEISFPPGSSWIVQTDHVSHAAMEGQYVLEQTFYLPVKAMKNESLAPVSILERMLGKRLV